MVNTCLKVCSVGTQEMNQIEFHSIFQMQQSFKSKDEPLHPGWCWACSCMLWRSSWSADQQSLLYRWHTWHTSSTAGAMRQTTIRHGQVDKTTPASLVRWPGQGDDLSSARVRAAECAGTGSIWSAPAQGERTAGRSRAFSASCRPAGTLQRRHERMSC